METELILPMPMRTIITITFPYTILSTTSLRLAPNHALHGASNNNNNGLRVQFSPMWGSLRLAPTRPLNFTLRTRVRVRTDWVGLIYLASKMAERERDWRLFKACEDGDINALKRIIAEGADPRGLHPNPYRTYYAESQLHVACR